MSKLFTLAIAVSLALAGCGKKDDNTSAADQAKKEEAKPVDKVPPPPSVPKIPTTPVDPDKLMDVVDVPAGTPKECSDVRPIYVKIHDCAKLDEKMRAMLVKTWNDLVEGSLKRWNDASADDKKFIIDTCKKLPETAGQLVKDC